MTTSYDNDPWLKQRIRRADLQYYGVLAALIALFLAILIGTSWWADSSCSDVAAKIGDAHYRLDERLGCWTSSDGVDWHRRFRR